jgi:hypothetical protein
VLQLIWQDAACGISHRYLERLPILAVPTTITVSRAALILGKPPCRDEGVITWLDACHIFGRAADRLYADPPPFDYPEPDEYPEPEPPTA